MTVTETVSTGGGYKVFSVIDVRDTATAMEALVNELETHSIPITLVRFVLGFDSDTKKPIIMAICKTH